MSRTKLLILAIAPIALLSGCSLRQPVYNPVLGGFPMYKHMKQVSHEVESRESERQSEDSAKSQAGVRAPHGLVM
jgi:hypothetical protein